MSTPEATRSPLEAGIVVTLAALGFCALIGLIAVVDADSVGSALGMGIGIAFLVFLNGATIAVALACLARQQAEVLAFGGLVAAGLSLDLIVLALWLEIDSSAYGKFAGVAFTWAFFALIVLGLTLAIRHLNPLARGLYRGAVVASLAAGLIATWLIGSARTGEVVVADSPIPLGPVPDGGLLRPLAVALILLATLWFGAIAASRLEPPRADVTG